MTKLAERILAARLAQRYLQDVGSVRRKTPAPALATEPGCEHCSVRRGTANTPWIWRVPDRRLCHQVTTASQKYRTLRALTAGSVGPERSATLASRRTSGGGGAAPASVPQDGLEAVVVRARRSSHSPPGQPASAGLRVGAVDRSSRHAPTQSAQRLDLTQDERVGDSRVPRHQIEDRRSLVLSTAVEFDCGGAVRRGLHRGGVMLPFRRRVRIDPMGHLRSGEPARRQSLV